MCLLIELSCTLLDHVKIQIRTFFICSHFFALVLMCDGNWLFGPVYISIYKPWTWLGPLSACCLGPATSENVAEGTSPAKFVRSGRSGKSVSLLVNRGGDER